MCCVISEQRLGCLYTGTVRRAVSAARSRLVPSGDGAQAGKPRLRGQQALLMSVLAGKGITEHTAQMLFPHRLAVCSSCLVRKLGFSQSL